MILDLLKNIRSHRSFTTHQLTKNELRYMIEGARYASCAKNSQNIRYVLITDSKICDLIFSHCKFAGAITWNQKLSESPRGYILMCVEKNFKGNENLLYFDMGIASQNILLVANDLGYNGCIIGAFNKKEVEKIIDLDDSYYAYMLIALGKAQDIVSVVPTVCDNVSYSRIDNNHYVPKLPLDKIIIMEK